MSFKKKVDNFTQGCQCDQCGKELTAQVIWIWEEHFCCTEACVEKSYYEARPELRSSATLEQEVPNEQTPTTT